MDNINAKFLSLDDIKAYTRAFELSNFVWNIAIKWEYFPKVTVGKQFVNAVDSVSANIAEGFGRYFKKEKIRFYQIAKGSLTESVDWTRKSRVRNLLTEEEFIHIQNELQTLPKEINSLIKYTNIKLTI